MDLQQKAALFSFVGRLSRAISRDPSTYLDQETSLLLEVYRGEREPEDFLDHAVLAWREENRPLLKTEGILSSKRLHAIKEILEAVRKDNGSRETTRYIGDIIFGFIPPVNFAEEALILWRLAGQPDIDITLEKVKGIEEKALSEPHQSPVSGELDVRELAKSSLKRISEAEVMRLRRRLTALGKKSYGNDTYAKLVMESLGSQD